MFNTVQLIVLTIILTLVLVFWIITYKVKHKEKRGLILFSCFTSITALSKLVPLIDGFIHYSPRSFIYTYAMYLCWFGSSFVIYLGIQSLLIKPHRTTTQWLKRIILFFFSMAILGGILGIHKQNFSSQLYVFIFQLSSVLYTLSIYLILCLHIRKHNRLIKEEYSNSENRNLNWLLYLFAAYIGCALLIVLLRSTNLIERSIRQYFELFFQMGWYIILFYKTLHYELSTSYIYQQNSSPHPSKYALKNEKEETKTFSSNFKNTKTELAQEELKKFFQQIEHTVVKKALYLNPTLTISDVNKETKIQPWIISKAIHTQKHNFNTYINELRIEHAQKLLLSQEQEHLSIEGIGKIAGFKSNSAFYRAFYNVHHTTPLQYKKERKCS